jgi:ABC-type sugar transport system ATPase subunit
MSECILQMNNITKVFGGVHALESVDFNLRAGEIHAIVGENGAGKSTLMKILLGIIKPDKGEIIYKGKPVIFPSPAAALKSGISMIHQEVSLIPDMSVAENIWLCREERFCAFGNIGLSVKKCNKAAANLLRTLGLRIDIRKPANRLSVAQVQLVELARAISYDPQIIIMDEPTSSLTDQEVEVLYRIVREQTSKGVSVVFISHKLEEVLAICERVTILRDGRLVEVRDSKALTKQDLINAIAGRTVTKLYDKVPSTLDEVVFEVKNLVSGTRVNNVSFRVRKGEIYGLCGLAGAGRSEILQAVFGIDKKHAGTIMLNGKQLNIKKPKHAVGAGIGMVTEDRMRRGLIYMLSIQANSTISAFRHIANRFGIFRPQKERQLFDTVAGNLQIKYNSAKDPVTSLSGGNQQKVIISRWMLIAPTVLILDEPTRGIDVGSKDEIYKLIDKLSKEGLAIVMVSSELPEIFALCDRIGVVHKGRIVYECDRENATQELLMKYAFGETDDTMGAASA